MSWGCFGGAFAFPGGARAPSSSPLAPQMHTRKPKYHLWYTHYCLRTAVLQKIKLDFLLKDYGLYFNLFPTTGVSKRFKLRPPKLTWEQAGTPTFKINE